MLGELNRHGYPIDRTGLDAWSLKMKRENAKKMAVLEAKDRPDLREAEVVDAGHEIPLEGLSKRSTVGKIAHLAFEHGWLVKVGASHYRTADRFVKEEIVEGKVVEHSWVNAISPDGKHHLSVSKEVIVLDGWPVMDTEEVKAIDEVKVHIMELGNQE